MKLINTFVIDKFFSDWQTNADGSFRNFNINNGVIENWNNADREKPTETEIQSWYDGLSDYWTNINIQLNRKNAYPSIKEQLDMQYWDSVNGTNTWQDKINEIKTKYPKE